MLIYQETFSSGLTISLSLKNAKFYSMKMIPYSGISHSCKTFKVGFGILLIITVFHK